jgi:rubrerythrin
VAEALSWVKGRALQDLLVLCMALETDSYDLYIKMSRTVTGEPAQKVFARLVTEEKEHLARMAKLLDDDIGKR